MSKGRIMCKDKSKSKNDGTLSIYEESRQKDNKSSALLSNIMKKYPWPVQEDSKGNAGMENVKGNITQHDVDEKEVSDQMPEYDQAEIASTVACPECGKVFVGLDEHGCFVQDFGRCEDAIGSGDDGDIYFEKEFDVLSNILSIYHDYIGDYEACRYISHLTGADLEKDEDWSSFLEQLGISVTINESYGDGPGGSGYYSFLTVHRDLQAGLLKKLKVIKSRLAAFEEAYENGELETHIHCETIADFVDEYGTNIPTGNLMEFVDCDPPPIGHLTTMLLINWLKKIYDLTKPNGYGQLNDYIFLNWLAKGRQKKIIKSLAKNITKDTEVAKVYEYLKRLSSMYVNEEMPRFGGPANSVGILRYKSNKELYSGFYIWKENDKGQG